MFKDKDADNLPQKHEQLCSNYRLHYSLICLHYQQVSARLCEKALVLNA